MPRDHFAQMSRQTSHRHDTPHDSYEFDRVVNTITGMLYSIVTLKAFFLSLDPLLKSLTVLLVMPLTQCPQKLRGRKNMNNYPYGKQLSMWMQTR